MIALAADVEVRGKGFASPGSGTAMESTARR